MSKMCLPQMDRVLTSPASRGIVFPTNARITARLTDSLTFIQWIPTFYTNP